MNINELQAGRELDALVAERVMNANRWDVYACDMVGDPPENYQQWIREENVPHYSTDIADAWQVWERLPRKLHDSDVFALEVSLSDCPPWRYDTDPKRRYIVTAKWHGETQYSGAASTPELAICRAALKAMREVTK